MALFFDAPWFDEKLSARGLSRAVMAIIAGLSEDELALVFKDQREVSAGQVASLAELLGVPQAEIASRAGVSTPVPRVPPDQRLEALERRVAALESEIEKLRRS